MNARYVQQCGSAVMKHTYCQLLPAKTDLYPVTLPHVRGRNVAFKQDRKEDADTTYLCSVNRSLKHEFNTLIDLLPAPTV